MVRLLMLFLGVLLSGRLMAAVDVQTAWGFDGTVVPGGPNLLGVMLTNTGDKAIEGTVVLQSGSTMRSHSEPWVTHIFLAPHDSRRVEFAPWINRRDDAWTLSGTLLARAMELTVPRHQKPGRILLVATDDPGGARNGLRIFDEERFPATVALCDSLGELVMDHPPRRWSSDQSQALQDWISAGGTLHLLKGMNGEWPAFTGDLAALAGQETRQNLGSGHIIRHQQNRGNPPAEWPTLSGTDRDLEHNNSSYRRSLTDQLAQGFAMLTRPEHPWWLINLVLLIFLLTVGLGPWLTGRKGVDWRWINVTLVLLIAGTAWLMTVIGRRGYGEEAVLRSVTLARQVTPTTWDACQWANLFVVASDRYPVTHAGNNRLYTGIGEDPDPASVITIGREGNYQPVIPLFSNRPFAVRLRQEWTPPLVIEGNDVVRWTGSAPPLDPLLLSDTTVGYLVRRGKVHNLQLKSAGSTDIRYVLANNSEDRAAFIKRQREIWVLDNATRTPDAFHTAMLPLVVAEDLHHLGEMGRDEKDQSFAYLLVTALPDALRATTTVVMRQDGAVIYRIPFPSTP